MLLIVVGAPYRPNVGRERRLEARLALACLRANRAAPSPRRRCRRRRRRRCADRSRRRSPGCSCRAGLRRRLPRSAASKRGTGSREELAANVVVADGRAHGVAADRHALDERVRVVAQDVAIVAGAGLALVRVAHQVLLHRRVARHEAPLHAGGEARAAAAAQAGSLHGIDDLLARRASRRGSSSTPRSRRSAGRSRASTSSRMLQRLETRPGSFVVQLRCRSLQLIQDAHRRSPGVRCS